MHAMCLCGSKFNHRCNKFHYLCRMFTNEQLKDLNDRSGALRGFL